MSEFSFSFSKKVDFPSLNSLFSALICFSAFARAAPDNQMEIQI